MDKIMKKRVEEAANDRYTDNTFAYVGFIDGAEYALSHQWISVEEALPENRVKVLVKTKKGRTGIAWLYQYKTLTGELSEQRWSGGYIYVTHWMPIPKLDAK